jgi:hypothetical protein
VKEDDDEIPDNITELKTDLVNKRFSFQPGIISNIISNLQSKSFNSSNTLPSFTNIQIKIKNDSLKDLENSLKQIIRRNVMKTFLGVCFLVAFIGLLIIGCSDKSTSPVQTTGVNDNPVVLQKDTGPGAWIYRYEGSWYYVFFDEEAGLILTLGLNDIEKNCAGEGGYDVINVKDLYLPNADPDLRRIITQEKADVTAIVWQADAFPGWDFWCDFILNNEPFARGIVNYSYKDNDYFAWAQDNSNTNSFGYKANGTLKGNGKVYKLNFNYRFIWDPSKNINLNEVFNIKLTPTGK